MMERFRAFWTKVFSPIAHLLIRLGVSPDAVTLDRLADGAIFIGLALYFAWQEPSRLYLVLSLVCLLMGAVTSYARSRGETLGFQVKVGIAERADRLVLILVMTGLGAIFDLPVLMYIALWALAIASTVTVAQRVWVVRKQALAEAALPSPHE